MGKLVLKIISIQVLFVLLFLFFQRQNQITSRSGVELTQTLGAEDQKESPGLPVRLRIPAIEVDAYVGAVGVNSSGEMAVPANSHDVGWFEFGPRPGERGSSVITGHLDSESGEDGVFVDLNKLQMGDLLYIEDDRGVTVTFRVRESRIYDPGYADEVFDQSEGEHLNLITCDGAWDGDKKSFKKRLVVFTDKILDN